MSPRQRQKRNEDALIRQQPATPLADAVIIGTAVGGLVAGIQQAHAGDLAEESVQPALPVQFDAAPSEQPAPLPTEGEQKDLAALASDPVPAASALEGPTAPTVVAPSGEVASGPEAAPADPTLPDVSDPMVQNVAAEIAATFARVAESAASGSDAQGIASDIVAAAQQIVAQFNPADGASSASLPLATELVGEVVEQTTSIVDTVLEQTGSIAETVLAGTGGVVEGVTGIADTVLSEVAGIPAQVLGAGSVIDQVATLPASLLGFEGSDAPGGFLSEIFYDDGQADLGGNLSDAAASFVSDIAPLSLAMLGQSYGDPDLPGLHLNALGLL